MADIDIKKLIELLQEAVQGKERTTSAQQKTVKERSEAPLETNIEGQKTFNQLLEEGKKKYTDIAEKIKIVEQNRKDLIDDEQIILELEEERIEQLKNQFQINQKNLLNLIEQLKVGKEKGDLSEEELKDLKEKIRILKGITDEQGRELENQKKQKELKEGILSIVKQTWEASKQYGSELEKHIIAISKANGGYADLLGNLREAGRLSQAATLGTGITGEENMRALEALSDSFIGLTTYSAQSISNLQVATAQLTKVGVSSGIAAKSFDSLVLAMGKTPEQAVKIQDSFVQMAAKNRLALGAVTQAFAENSSRFVGYGEQMTKVLDGLAEQSLKTGIALNKLVGIAQQFDTFEGAAKAVGNLNALLGGDYLNSIELLTASDDERIRLLKEGVAASGLQWESMNRFQKMAIANAAGITDLNEAAKMFGQTSLQNTRQQREGAEVQKTLAEQAESVSLGMDKLKSTLNGLFIALDPFISAFRFLVDMLVFFPNLASKIGGIGGQIAAAFTSIAIGIGILVVKNRVLGAAWNYLANNIGKATARLLEWKTTSSSVGGGVPNAAAAISPAAPGAAPVSGATSGLLANAGNMAKAAGAMLIFAAALFVLAKALQEFSSKDINAQGMILAGVSLGVLTGIMVALNNVKSEITKGAIVVGIMSIALLAFAVSLGILSKVDWKVVALMSVALIGIGLAIIGLAALVQGPQALLLAIGIGIIIGIAIALMALGKALSMIVEAIKSAAPAITDLGNSFKALFEIKDLSSNISSIKSLLSDLATIDVDPINNLANAIYNLATNLQTLAAIPSKMGISVTGKSDLTETINKTVANAAEATTAISKATTEATSQALIPAQQTTAFVPLVVQIDKKNILNVLSEDIKILSKSEALNVLDGVGISQSAQGIQDRLASLVNR